MAIENIGLYPITIDVYKKHKESTVYANDNDLNGRGLLINLVKNNASFDSTGITLKIGFRNAVGEERLYDCDIVDVLTGQYKVFYPTEMLVGNGGRVVKLEIKAYESTGALLNYAPLFVYVNASEIPDEALGGMNEVSTLTQAIFDVESFKPQMETFLIESDAAIEASISSANIATTSAITATNNANIATTSANNKIVDVENRFTTLTASQQADAEVIDARQGEVSLGANLTKFSAQLADITQQTPLKSPLENLVKNGNFANGGTYWVKVGTFTTSIASNTCSFTVLSTGDRMQQRISSSIGDKIYRRAIVKSNSSLVGLGDTTSILKAHSGNGTFEALSHIRTETFANRYISVVDTRTVGFDEIQIKSVLAINLTKVFGLGSEPSLEEMDKFLSIYTDGWFDGITNGTASYLVLVDDKMNNNIKYLENIMFNGEFIIKNWELGSFRRWIIQYKNSRY